MLAGIGFSAFLVLSKQAAVESVFWPLVIARAASMTIMLLICLIARRPWIPATNALKFIVVAGVLDSVGNALFVATRRGRLDVAARCCLLYIRRTTVLLARFVLKNASRRCRRRMSSALIAVPLIREVRAVSRFTFRENRSKGFAVDR